MADEAPATTPVQVDDAPVADAPAAVDTIVTPAADTPAADNPDSAAPAADTSDTADTSDADTTGDADQATPPESYADFTLPEGVELDSAALESVTPLLKETGLTQDAAQKFVDWYAEQVQAGSTRQTEAFNQLMSDWREQSSNDKEFGGDKFEESVGLARTAIDKFGTPELNKLLTDHGVGNHPEVIRFMMKVGRLTKEDVPGGNTVVSNPQKDRVSLLYPDKSA